MNVVIDTAIGEGPIASLEFVAFDIETTGLSAQSDRIVEIGALRFRADGTELDRFDCLVHPGRPIPAQVTSIHGITDKMVRGAPAENEVLPEFVSFLGDVRRTVLMAHNASFDVGFLELALARAGFDQPAHDVLDTVRFARRRARGLPGYSLTSLVRTFGVASSTDHRGLADAAALKELFGILMAMPPRLMETKELLGHLSPEHRFGSPRRGGGRSPRLRSRGRSIRQSMTLAGDDSRWDEVLTAAIQSGSLVRLRYDGGRSPGTTRLVRPIEIVSGPYSPYLVAICERDQIRKNFRLDRVREARLD